MKQSSGLIKQGSLMFFAVAIFNILNLLYQLYMVRNLTTINYGILNSLLSILVIVSIPSGTLQTVVTKYISTFHTNNHPEKINILIRSLVKRTLAFGFVALLILILGSGGISSFIKIESSSLIVILGLTAFFSIILPIAQGGLQGLQKFGYLGLVMITNGGLKLLLGIIFIRIGYGVAGAMSALAIAVFITLFLAFLMLASVLPGTSASMTDDSRETPNNLETDVNFSEIHRYSYAVAAVYLCFMILTNLDVVLVKHFFNPMEAGYYSISQMVGKIILFLPTAVTLVMFPQTSRLHAQTKDTLHILQKGIVYVGILSGAAVLICFACPELIIKLLSGQSHAECVPLARFFAATMFFYALTYVVLFYHLSIGRVNFIYLLVLLTVFQVLAIALFHQSLLQVICIMGGNAVLLFAANLYIAFKAGKGSVAA
ncbi:MAG: oligosaccharide flippase family protein [Sedimentisphaerales bacterium]|nr:oligosaccharide flippase family protein [Sedimentisphaerales bacterium]